MKTDLVLYALGVLCASAVGFFSPCWFLGFGPLSVGLIATVFIDFEREVASGKPPSSPFPSR